MKNSIAKDSVKLSGSRIMTTIINTLAAMLVARFRTLGENGTYSQLLLAINLANSIFMLGFPNSINYFLAKMERQEECNQFLSVYYSVSTILSILTGALLALTAPLLAEYFKNSEILKYIFFLAMYPWTQIIMSSIDNILIIYGKTNKLVSFRVMHSSFLLLLIFIVKLAGWDFYAYMWLLLLGEILFAGVIYGMVNGIDGHLRISFEQGLIRKIAAFSIPMGLATVVGTLHIEFDKLFIGKYFSTEELAIYTMSSKELPVSVVAGSISAVLLPRMVRLFKKGKGQDAVILWGNSIVLSYILISILCTGLFVYAPEAMSLLYSEKYLPGMNVFRIYCIVLLLKCAYFGTVLNAVGQSKMIFYSSIIALGMNVILNFVCYFIWGFQGPAIATLITTILVAVFQLYASAKRTKISFREIFPWKKMAAVSGINILLGIAFGVLKIISPLEQMIGDIPEALLLGGIWGIIYLAVMRKQIKDMWDTLNRA